MDFFEEINGLEYLYFLSIEDDQSNSLVLVIKEATISADKEPIMIDGKSLGVGRRVELEGPGKCYKVNFDRYAAYQITNESYAVYEDDPERIGRLYCHFSGSQYLKYVRETTHAEYMFHKPLRHFAFNCCNHTIDIISDEIPEITYYMASAT